MNYPDTHTRYGNEIDLIVRGSEHTMIEVAAIENVFCALKKKGYALSRVSISISSSQLFNLFFFPFIAKQNMC